MTVVIVTMAIESTLLLLLLLLPMLLPPLPACGLDADDVQGCEVIGDPLSPVCPMMLYNPAKMPGFSRECLARNLAVNHLALFLQPPHCVMHAHRSLSSGFPLHLSSRAALASASVPPIQRMIY